MIYNFHTLLDNYKSVYNIINYYYLYPKTIHKIDNKYVIQTLQKLKKKEVAADIGVSEKSLTQCWKMLKQELIIIDIIQETIINIPDEIAALFINYCKRKTDNKNDIMMLLIIFYYYAKYNNWKIQLTQERICEMFKIGKPHLRNLIQMLLDDGIIKQIYKHNRFTSISDIYVFNKEIRSACD